MHQEIELKLLVKADHLPLLSGLLQQLDAQDQGVKVLENIYYDTPKLDLNQAKAALRLRKTAQSWLQTLKTAGSNQGGLSCRGELEVAVPGQQLQPELLPLDLVPLAWQQQLEPKFRTDFQRHTWLLKLSSAQLNSTLAPQVVTAAPALKPEAQQHLIEIAADVGWATSPLTSQRYPINEVELELKQGSPTALLYLASYLAPHLAFVPGQLSKAELGWYLYLGQPLPQQAPASLSSSQESIKELKKVLDSKGLLAATSS